MKYLKKKTDPEKTPWLTCSKCGSRRVQQKSKEKVRCLDCGYIERFYVKQLYVYELGEQPENVSIYPVITDLKKIKL